MTTTGLRLALHARGLCGHCCEINDRHPKQTCSRCARRQYVVARLKIVQSWIAYYTQELKHLEDEDSAWRKVHGKRAAWGSKVSASGRRPKPTNPKHVPGYPRSGDQGYGGEEGDRSPKVRDITSTAQQTRRSA